ncbi:MAG: hypothetical protein R3C53_06585 [Pirellulaceae bacterium]
MPISGENLQLFMRIAGLGIICWLLIRSRGKNRRRATPAVKVAEHLKHNSNAATHQQTFTGTQSLGAPHEVLKWQVELHDLGRELKAELDSKLIAVRAMTQSYDQATQRLKSMIREAQQVHLGPTSPLAIARRLADEGWSNARIAEILGLNLDETKSLLELPRPSSDLTHPSSIR